MRVGRGMRQIRGHSMWEGGEPGWQSDQLDRQEMVPQMISIILISINIFGEHAAMQACCVLHAGMRGSEVACLSVTNNPCGQDG